MHNIAPQMPLNHYQLATLINKMLGYTIENPNQKDDSYFITGGDIRGLSERVTYHLNALPSCGTIILRRIEGGQSLPTFANIGYGRQQKDRESAKEIALRGLNA
ncbi:hypothetical protein [Klebsiella aerogenes]|uniref:hypothetical protein n=1 Tax=Klebsiella aerogenes TaxID=548 RepID=UPI0035E44B4E